MPKWKQERCEVCGEVVNPLGDYLDLIKGQAYSPRDYVEHTLNMSEDEKIARTKLFTELFAANPSIREEELVHQA